MSGLANKSLPFTSDGYFAVASSFELPFNVASIKGTYLFQLEGASEAIGEARHPEVVNAGLIIKLNLPPPNCLSAVYKDPQVDLTLIIGHMPRTKPEALSPVRDGTASIGPTAQLRASNQLILNKHINSNVVESELRNSLRYTKQVNVELGSTPFKGT